MQLLILAIVLWNTVYISRAVDALRAKGVDIPEEYLQHISPLGWEHITLTGDYVWNLNQKASFNNLRPLREKNSIKNDKLNNRFLNVQESVDLCPNCV